MSAVYSVLLRLSVSHAFFPADSTTRFQISPTPQCAALLARFGILLRQGTDGLALVGQPCARGELLDAAAPPLDLEFWVHASDSYFSLYTVLDAPAPDACLFFHSAQARQEQPGIWRLHPGEQAGQSAWQLPVVPNKLAGRSFGPARPACVIALALQDVAAALQAADSTPVFTVRFGARKSVWKYYFLSELPAQQPAIVDLDGVLTFTALGRTALAGNRSALAFASEQAIEMRQTHAQRLQLRDRGDQGERILIKRLPHPRVAAVGREIAEEGAVPVLVSEIYIS